MKKMTDTVVLIDDDLEDAYLISRAIEKTRWQGEFVHFTNGADFLSAFQESVKGCSDWLYHSQVLLFIDIRMPGDDGFSVLRSIREDEQMKCMPVCMLTTSISSVDVLRAYSLGANCYLCKSNNFEETKDQVGKTLDFWFQKSIILPPRAAA